MNAWWVEDEMDYALKDSSPKVLICDEERLHRFEKIRADFPDLKVLTVRCDGQSQDTRLETALETMGTPSLSRLIRMTMRVFSIHQEQRVDPKVPSKLIEDAFTTL